MKEQALEEDRSDPACSTASQTERQTDRVKLSLKLCVGRVPKAKEQNSSLISQSRQRRLRKELCQLSKCRDVAHFGVTISVTETDEFNQHLQAFLFMAART
jgi:hypothetical protein